MKSGLPDAPCQNSVRLSHARKINGESQSIRGSASRSLRKLRSTAVTLFSRAGNKPSSYWSIYTFRQKMHFGWRAIRQHRRVRKSIRAHQIVGDLPDSFVLLSLHYQPERTTDPDSGRWRDQVSFVEMVRKLLDDACFIDTALLVKEHPRQAPLGFPDLRQLHYRDKHFYESLCALHDTFLIPTSQSMEELIGRASLVASPNGSLAWMGLSNGVPALTGRSSWFSDCQATVTIDEVVREPELLVRLMNVKRSEVLAQFRSWSDTETRTFPGVSMGIHWVGANDDTAHQLMATALLDRIF